MLVSIIAVAIVVVGIVAYVYVFNRVRNGQAVVDADDTAESAAEEPKQEEDASGKPTEIFKAVDELTNTQETLAPVYDSSESGTKTVSFEEKIGKETVVVEIPEKGGGRKSRRAVKKAPAKEPAKKAPAKKPATPAELIAVLNDKIAKRRSLLKVAGIAESGDKQLAKLRASLDELNVVVAASPKKVAEEKATAKKASKKAPAKKEEKKAPAKKPVKKAPTKTVKPKTAKKK